MSWCPWICRPWPQHYPHMADDVTANPAIQTINCRSAAARSSMHRSPLRRRLTPFQPQLSSASRSRHGTAVYNDTTILYWSDETYRIFGFDPRNELPSREAALQRIHPDDRERAQEVARRGMREKKDYKFEFRLGLPATIKYIEGIAHPKFSASGELVEVVGTIIDVTERKRAEATLLESELKLRQIIETVPSLLWSTGPDGEVTYINQRVLDYLGIRLEDFRHRGWEAFLHPADLPETARAFYQAIQTGTSHQSVHRVRRADGEYRWHQARAEPLRDRQGCIVQWYGLSVDIDDATEEALRESEARSRSTLDGIAGLVVVLAPNGEVETVNRQVFEYFGRSLEWLKNWGTNDMVHPEDLPRRSVWGRHVGFMPFPMNDKPA